LFFRGGDLQNRYEQTQGGGNRQNRSTETIEETKKEDKEESRDCSQQKGRRRIKRSYVSYRRN
jgi:hypothetical protein